MLILIVYGAKQGCIGYVGTQCYRLHSTANGEVYRGRREVPPCCWPAAWLRNCVEQLRQLLRDSSWQEALEAYEESLSYDPSNQIALERKQMVTDKLDMLKY